MCLCVCLYACMYVYIVILKMIHNLVNFCDFFPWWIEWIFSSFFMRHVTNKWKHSKNRQLIKFCISEVYNSWIFMTPPRRPLYVFTSFLHLALAKASSYIRLVGFIAIILLFKSRHIFSAILGYWHYCPSTLYSLAERYISDYFSAGTSSCGRAGVSL